MRLPVIVFVIGAICALTAFGQEPVEQLTNSVGMVFSRIPKGSFLMGSPETEKRREDDETQHRVTITKDFYMGTTEVTQAQYEKVMGLNPSFFQGGQIKGSSSNHPVERVLWADAVDFCKRLSDRPEEKMAGRVYRLPTEAEWEYACRAGTESEHSFGDSIDSWEDYAWCKENSLGRTRAVGLKKPNAWGLFDMYGNVEEWCEDAYDRYPTGEAIDPKGPDFHPKKKPFRVVRGGAYQYSKFLARSAARSYDSPKILVAEGKYNGFRVVLTQSE